MRICQYCDKEELCGIGAENIPVCEEHFKTYLKGKRLAIGKVFQKATVSTIPRLKK